MAAKAQFHNVGSFDDQSRIFFTYKGREKEQKRNGGEQPVGGCLLSYLTDVFGIAHRVPTK